MKIPDLAAPSGTVVDIVVRAKNGHDITRACIDSIIKNTPEDSYRLILVDDGSEPTLYERRDQDVPALAELVDFYIRASECHGAVTASNLGIAVGLTRFDSDYLLILDNDTRVPDGDEGWLGRFVAELEAGGTRTACVGATTNFANPPQHILMSPQTYSADWKNEKEGRGGNKANPPAPWFVSFAVLFRKEALRRCGAWDERYNPGNFEDTDYSVVVREAGYEIRVARSVYIHHDGHQTFRDDMARLMAENGQKFAAKWGIGRLFDLGFVPIEQMRQVVAPREGAR